MIPATPDKSAKFLLTYILNRKELVSSLVIYDLCRVGQFNLRKWANSISPDKSAVFLLITIH